ncbi:MAG: tRNA (adenosine(37)-N6)-threonylcarbamoyltransferase complex ATPase subunit type 1 TsaE [Bacteroidetes bacterium]|nr:tRNA (adenosine(37)-N6)-threonylcarbamoyltransferase complex ATPase subunit type 1 TsaE [Bacteroidota bacterium]
MRFTLDAVSEVAKKLWVAGAKVSVWALYGELGAGKTTLVKAIVNEIGTSETIASPTFSIINQYRSRDAQTIYHFDFYRLKNETEAFDIGVDEYFDSGNLCLIEWPEKISSLLPSSYFEIRIEIIDHHTRLIRYQTHG